MTKKGEKKKLLVAIALRMPNMVGIFSSTEQMSFTRHHFTSCPQYYSDLLEKQCVAPGGIYMR